MESSSICEKNKEFICGEKLKKITFENSPFDLKILALKLVEKTTEIGMQD